MNSLAHAFNEAERKKGLQSLPSLAFSSLKTKKSAVTAEKTKRSVHEPTTIRQEIARFDQVLIYVPRLSLGNMEFVPARTEPNIAGHFRNGQVVEGKIIVNRNYYDLPESFLGKIIVATVVVFSKIIEERKFVYLDIFFTPEKLATKELKFLEEGQIEIPGSKTKIKIADIQSRQRI